MSDPVLCYPRLFRLPSELIVPESLKVFLDILNPVEIKMSSPSNNSHQINLLLIHIKLIQNDPFY